MVDKKKYLGNPQGTFNKMTLIYTDETKFLGVHITEMLEWNTHVKSQTNKLRKVSFMMKSLKVIMNQLMIHNIYFSKSTHFYGLEYCLAGEGGNQIKKNI